MPRFSADRSDPRPPFLALLRSSWAGRRALGVRVRGFRAPGLVPQGGPRRGASGPDAARRRHRGIHGPGCSAAGVCRVAPAVRPSACLLCLSSLPVLSVCPGDVQRGLGVSRYSVLRAVGEGPDARPRQSVVVTRVVRAFVYRERGASASFIRGRACGRPDSSATYDRQLRVKTRHTPSRTHSGSGGQRTRRVQRGIGVLSRAPKNHDFYSSRHARRIRGLLPQSIAPPATRSSRSLASRPSDRPSRLEGFPRGKGREERMNPDAKRSPLYGPCRRSLAATVWASARSRERELSPEVPHALELPVAGACHTDRRGASRCCVPNPANTPSVRLYPRRMPGAEPSRAPTGAFRRVDGGRISLPTEHT